VSGVSAASEEDGEFMSDLLPDAETGKWLLAFWESRDQVTPETQCPTPLEYEDGTTGRCVLSREHLDIDRVPVDVPHADKDGRLAPLLVHRQTILEARALEESDRERASSACTANWVAPDLRLGKPDSRVAAARSGLGLLAQGRPLRR
jgi:hypothetical protein